MTLNARKRAAPQSHAPPLPDPGPASWPIAVTQSCLSKVLLSLGSLAFQQLFASTKFYLALTRAEAVPPRLLLTVMFSGLAIPLNFAL
jgi:hypothetical protein